MVSAKILFVFLVMIILFAAYIFLIGGGKSKYEAVTQQGIDQISNTGVCWISTFNNKCSERSTDSTGLNCVVDGSGNPEYDCTLCEKTINDNTIYSCQFAVCGCGVGWKETLGSVSLSLEKVSYKPGDVIVASGTVRPSVEKDPSAADVSFSFLDFDKKETGELGTGGTSDVDSAGKYEIGYEIPAGAEKGSYFILARYEGARSIASFSVE